MNIAYLISAHTDAAELKRLIEALHKDAEFFVHIDKKTDISAFTSIIKAENVHFIENRIDVVWGTFREVQYQMALIRAAVKHPTHFDYIFFISGMDYPLWSNKKITKFLEQNKGKEFLMGINLASKEVEPKDTDIYRKSRPQLPLSFIGKNLNTKLNIATRKCLAALGLRKSLQFKVDGKIWDLYKGSAWWSISEELAVFILNQFDSKPEIMKYFKDSFGSAETLIQTIAFNSPEFKDKCMLKEGTYTTLAALTPLHYIDYTGNIKIMSENDFDMLMATGKMFTRKLRSGVSDKLVEMIERERI